MRSRTRTTQLSAAIILTLVGIPGMLFAATPLQIWGQESPPAQLSAADLEHLPVDLIPAFRFQTLYSKIISGAKTQEWRSELVKSAASQTTDQVSLGVREAARVWLARAEMEDIDALLLDYYTHNIRFPKTDEEFQKLLPEGLSKDPWVQSWVYASAGPHGFSAAMSGQRYQLAPTSMPGLLSLKDALKNRQPLKFSSTITRHDIADHHSLEFRSPQNVAVIEPGGKAESYTLLYVGDHWALMSGVDRIFAIPF